MKVIHQDHVMRIRDLQGNVRYEPCESNIHKCNSNCYADNCPVEHEIAKYIPL